VSTAPPPRLSDEERHRYAFLADLLIPEDAVMPSATQADVVTYWVDVALDFRPDLLVALREAIGLVGDDNALTVLGQLGRDRPDVHEALGTLTVGAYFLNPRVRALAGYPGQVTRAFVDEVPTYLDILSRVVERGSIYRPTPAVDVG
jgi:hypothetical protein